MPALNSCIEVDGVIMKKPYLTLLLLAFSVGAHAREYKSFFEFKVDLTDDWLVLPPGEAANIEGVDSMESIGLPATADKENFSRILKRLRNGEIEYYLDKKYSTGDSNNNVSVQIVPDGMAPSLDEIEEGCKSLVGDLEKVFSSKVDIASCGPKTLGGITFIAYEYRVVALPTHAIQYEIPLHGLFRVVIVGGSNLAGLDAVRRVTDDLAQSAIRDLSNKATACVALAKASYASGDYLKSVKFMKMAINEDLGTVADLDAIIMASDALSKLGYPDKGEKLLLFHSDMYPESRGNEKYLAALRSVSVN
jgi:hypothetical protein